MKTDTTFIAYISRISGSEILAIIPEDVKGTTRHIGSREYRLGRVGSYVRIPLAETDVYGLVTQIGSRMPHGQDAGDASHTTKYRWIQVQLVCEVNHAGQFYRGVSNLPTLDDEVHIATLENLAAIRGTEDPFHIQIGTQTSEDLPANINLDKLVTRHAAILGSTGSGKSNTVALLLKSLTEGTYPNTKIVVIDLHGEYKDAFRENSRVFSLRDSKNPLVVPYWVLSFDELAWFLVDRHGGTESQQDKILRSRIYEEKKKSCAQVKSGAIEEAFLTPDTPIFFDLKKVWYDLYVDEHATYLEKDNLKKFAYTLTFSGEPSKGNAAQVIPPQFEIASTSGNPPFPSPKKAGMDAYVNKIYTRLKDRSFDFLLNPAPYNGTQKDLPDLLRSWLGHEHPITVLNLEGIPFEIVDLVVGAATKILFQSMFWGRNLPGLGRQRPLLIVYEEAHAYLAKAKELPFISGYSRTAVRRIFKEGRKYGVGGILVSQRPSELDPTILSEVGTYIALRLTNNEDQNLIRATLPDTLTGLTDLLSSLRTGEAIIGGEAVQIPVRVHLPLVEPRLHGSDSEPAERWLEEPVKEIPYEESVQSWRRQQMPWGYESND